jgi:hypothetical protein
VSVDAGDGIKPLKGWSYHISREYIDPATVADNPYFQSVIEKFGPPPYAIAIVGVMHLNATGNSLHNFVEIGYPQFDDEGNYLSTAVFCTGVIVAANGDEIQAHHVADVRYENDLWVFDFELFITGGTGRFTGANGWLIGRGSELNAFGSTFDGWISTVGSTMRDK